MPNLEKIVVIATGALLLVAAGLFSVSMVTDLATERTLRWVASWVFIAAALTAFVPMMLVNLALVWRKLFRPHPQEEQHPQDEQKDSREPEPQPRSGGSQ